MGFLSVIRRWALREEMPIREIARRTGLSRNTIKKYLREGAVEPKSRAPNEQVTLIRTRIVCLHGCWLKHANRAKSDAQ